MAIRGWLCEGCKKHVRSRPWACPTCRKEVCDGCFSAFAHCKECSAKFTVPDLIHAANSQGWDFDIDDETARAQHAPTESTTESEQIEHVERNDATE